MLNTRLSSSARIQRQRGLSLVELMVGVAVGLFVVAGGAAMVGGMLGDNRRLLIETQVQQDLRSSADIITRELRRIGYWEQAENGVWSPTSAAQKNKFSPLITSTGSEVSFSYRRGSGQEGPFGFKLENGTIKTRLSSGWQELTDPRTVDITQFRVTEVDAPAVVLPCPKLCPDGTQACWPTLVAREFKVEITGEAVSDRNVRRSLTTNVRLRNDYVRFNLAASTDICPA